MQLVEEPIELSPWALWLVLCPVKHRMRQQFVLDSSILQLGRDPNHIAKMGALSHGNLPRHGLVPGDTQWEYRFHGRGCEMTNRHSGVQIDVDFLEGSADWITPFFFVKYLKSLKDPEFVEGRIQELYPTSETVELGLVELHNCGLIEKHFRDNCAFRLNSSWKTLSDISSCLESLEGQSLNAEVQTLFAAAASDWYLLEEANDAILQAEKSTIQRRNQLKKWFKSSELSTNALRAMADFNYSELDDSLRSALFGRSNPTMSEAVGIIEQRQTQEIFREQLLWIIDNVDPNGDDIAPLIWTRAACILLRSERPPDLSQRLEQVRSHGLSKIALVAMELNLGFVLDLIRRSLRSVDFHNRFEIAAALAIIDEKWCHDELIAVLSESTDQEMTTAIRSAILESRDSSVHEIVHQWERVNPYIPTDKDRTTIVEFLKRRDDEGLRDKMQTLHDQIYPLRASFRPGNKSK